MARTRRLLTFLALVAGLAAAPGAQAADAPCRPWAESIVASNLGVLENLAFDGSGGLLLSAWQWSAVQRLTPDGKVTRVVSNVKGPGGMAVVGDTLWLNTGDSPESGLLGLQDGTVEQVDLNTHVRSTWANGLTMPNGLALLPDGGALVSRDMGSPTGVTRIDNSGHPQAWAPIKNSNGIVVDAPNKLVYVTGVEGDQAVVFRVGLDDPKVMSVAGRLGSDQSLGLDDMTVDRHGVLYIAANSGGEVLTLDPRTGAHCVIASGMKFTSSLRFGKGAGWDPDALYVTSFDGSVTEVTPPAGLHPNRTTKPKTLARCCRSRCSTHQRRRRCRGRTTRGSSGRA
jgi:sugar lactone lactonase YvrE